MAALLIVYDLNTQGQNYQCVTKTIEQNFDTHWRFQKSAWLVETSLDEMQVATMLQDCLDVNDTLFVTTASQSSAWTGYDQDGTNWISAVL